MEENEINVDEDLHNSDWARSRHWDIHPATVKRLLEILGVTEFSKEDQKQAIRHFMTLPAAKPMPLHLKQELIKEELWNLLKGDK